MILFLIFFALIFLSYPTAHRIYKGNQRAIFFSYLRIGAMSSSIPLISGGLEWLNLVLFGAIFSFWIAATYGVMAVDKILSAER